MTDRRQKATKVKCKREESGAKHSIFGGIYSSLEEAYEFCWSSLAGEHSTLLKSTRRHVKLGKFVFGAPWLPDLLCKHWFASSVWNFCRWVADVPPRETSPAAKSEEKRMFSQATIPPVVVKTRGVNVPCSISITLSRILSVLLVLMLLVDLLRSQVFVRVCIMVTHADVEEGKSLSLPKTSSMNIQTGISGFVSAMIQCLSTDLLKDRLYFYIIPVHP